MTGHLVIEELGFCRHKHRWPPHNTKQTEQPKKEDRSSSCNEATSPIPQERGKQPSLDPRGRWHRRWKNLPDSARLQQTNASPLPKRTPVRCRKGLAPSNSSSSSFPTHRPSTWPHYSNDVAKEDYVAFEDVVHQSMEKAAQATDEVERAMDDDEESSNI